MTELAFQPNWASPPGETIAAILRAKSIPLHTFCNVTGLEEPQALGLLRGQYPINSTLANRIAASVGSTPRFWLDRERRFQSHQKTLEKMRPILEEWFHTFPILKMRERGWIPRTKTPVEGACELLDFFGVSTIAEWKAKYVLRLTRTQFRTSVVLENSIPATTAWLRRGEVIAEEMDCQNWDREGFRRSLLDLKPLSKIPDPRVFIPRLQRECAKHGVAVVVERCPAGCVASGATVMLGSRRAMLMLSARFLSDDHFWFSFFHEAGHLVLHGTELNLEGTESSSPAKEMEANRFAQTIILDPLVEADLQSMMINKFSIARFARRCCVSPGVIVGQLQNRERLSHDRFNAFKIRYRVSDLSPEIG